MCLHWASILLVVSSASQHMMAEARQTCRRAAHIGRRDFIAQSATLYIVQLRCRHVHVLSGQHMPYPSNPNADCWGKADSCECSKHTSQHILVCFPTHDACL